MSIKKTIYLIVMTIILCIMTLGYAALQERIDVEVEANIDSTYRIEITRVQEGTSVGDARSVSAPSYHDLTATFNVGLTNDTDSITYTIEITNYGTVDVRLNTAVITTTNNNIKTVKIGLSNGDIILHGGTKIFTVKMKLENTTSQEQTGTININLDCTRLKGGIGTVTEETYDAYVIGDIISFAGSNWYVIEDSGTNKDYVTLLKKTVLNSNQMGSFAYDASQYVMTYGSTNDYSISRVKEMLESVYLPIIGDSYLKDIDGYKIRLITKVELENNLGYTNNNKTDNTPSWIYTNFGEGRNNVNGYWTMSIYNSMLYHVWKTGVLWAIGPGEIRGVRPVINLYKNAID